MRGHWSCVVVSGPSPDSNIFQDSEPEWGGKEVSPTSWEPSPGHCLALSPTAAEMATPWFSPPCSEQGGGGGGTAKASLLRAYLLHIQLRQIDSLPASVGGVGRGLSAPHVGAPESLASSLAAPPWSQRRCCPTRGGGRQTDCTGHSGAHAEGAVGMRWARPRRPALQCRALPRALKSQPGCSLQGGNPG